MSIDHVCVVSNREVTDRGFGESANPKGLGEVNVGLAQKKESGDFVLQRFVQDDPETLPSLKLFQEYLAALRKEEKNCVLYVHGFNTSFSKSLEEAWDIHKTYDVGVVLFSWPSNPGGFVVNEYRRARRAAEASSPAFDNTLEKMALYLQRDFREHSKSGGDRDCRISLNLMCFSQGNYLLKRFIESDHFGHETRLFTNVVLMQADVDSCGHERWTAASGAFRRLYVTINENDRVLSKSEHLNPERLGKTIDNLVAKRVRYVDFTDAEGVGKKHGFFKSSNKPEKNTLGFFKAALNGLIPERVLQLQRDQKTGAFIVE